MTGLRRRLDLLLGAVSRLVLRIFFRRVEVVGRERLPEGARIVVANHVNGLIDALFVMGTLRIPARTLGKSTLWKIPVLAQLLDLAGVVPVVRRMDAGEDGAKNRDMFARCREELARGGTISLFPEGISHDEPRLQPLRTGAARIAIECGLEGTTVPAIVPVGLLFEERDRFRSRVLVVVGEPLDPSPEIASAAADEIGAVRALTARIAVALEAVTLNYRSWEEARWIEIGAEIVDREVIALPRPRTLAEQFATRRQLAAGLDVLRASAAGEVAATIDAVRTYDRMLRACGLVDAQVIAEFPPGPTLGLALRTLLRVLLAAPAALFGTVLHAIPFLAIRALSSRYRDEANQVATYKVFPSLVAYPVTWSAWGGAAWWSAQRLGTTGAVALSWGLGVALSAPFFGWIAVRFRERRHALWQGTRAFLMARRAQGPLGGLRQQRERVSERIEELVAHWRRLQESRDSVPG